jgi:hypothetical protein
MKVFKRTSIYLLAILYFLPAASYAAADPADVIHYDKKTDALTVHVDHMPLGEVLQKIGAKSGIKFSTAADLNRPVTMDFTAMPLDKAINSLVRPSSSAMIYSRKEDGTVVLSSVKIFDKEGGSSLSVENNRVRSLDKRADVPPAGGGFLGAAGVDRMVRENSGNDRRYRDSGTAVQDSDSPPGGASGSIRSALDASSSGGIRQNR